MENYLSIAVDSKKDQRVGEPKIEGGDRTGYLLNGIQELSQHRFAVAS